MDPELQRIIDKGIAAGLSDEDIRGLAQEHASRNPAPSAPASARDRLNAMAPGFPTMGAAARNVIDRPVSTIAKAAAPLAIPAVLSMATEYGAPAIQALARMAATALDKPLVGGGIGAVEGGRRGGVEGAIWGGLAGAAGSSALSKGLGKIAGPRVNPVAAGMSEAGAAHAASDAALLDATIARGVAKTDGAFASKWGTPPPAPAPTPAATSSTLQDELLSRLQNVDWRTQDAVPINAMKAKGILEPGESRVGLAERAAMSKDPAEIEMLRKALRQRMHISAKQ